MKIVWRNGRVGYFADMAITPIILIGVMLATGASEPLAYAAIAGFAAWQIFEWAAHRYVLHGLVRGQHWLHHREPTGDAGVPPVFTIPALLLLLALLILSFGPPIGGGLFAGFGLGYWTYNLTHWAIHAGYWPTSGLLSGVARRHALHHRGTPANFNVLLPICDLLFGTFRKA